MSAYKAWSRTSVVRVLTTLQKWWERNQAYTHDMVASLSAIFVTFRNDSLNLVVDCIAEPCKGATCFFNLSKICVSLCIHALMEYACFTSEEERCMSKSYVCDMKRSASAGALKVLTTN